MEVVGNGLRYGHTLSPSVSVMAGSELDSCGACNAYSVYAQQSQISSDDEVMSQDLGKFSFCWNAALTFRVGDVQDICPAPH